jgi:DNA-directed RNA polymerase specialized sigma24 family protein
MEFYGSTQWENEAVGRIDAERILSQLTPKQAEYVKRVYIDGERQADVARSNGVKRQAVEQALKLAKENIRRIVNGDVWREPGKPGRPRKHEKVCG